MLREKAEQSTLYPLKIKSPFMGSQKNLKNTKFSLFSTIRLCSKVCADMNEKYRLQETC